MEPDAHSDPRARIILEDDHATLGNRARSAIPVGMGASDRAERAGRVSSRPPKYLSPTRTKHPLVLVVDDKPDNREMYMEYLRWVGFRVVGASDGETAIAIANESHPAVILMDLSLPGVDGWEATRRLKEATATRGIHIVAVTGHAEAECRARAIDVGFDLFVAKPSLPLDIAERIAHLLGGKLERSRASRRP